MLKALERLKFRYQQVGNRLFDLMKEGRNMGFLTCVLHNYHLALQILYCIFVTGGMLKIPLDTCSENMKIMQRVYSSYICFPCLALCLIIFGLLNLL